MAAFLDVASFVASSLLVGGLAVFAHHVRPAAPAAGPVSVATASATQPAAQNLARVPAPRAAAPATAATQHIRKSVVRPGDDGEQEQELDD
ncbi:MAG TPA: hypothetical protein VMV50_02655 [Candidatus Paceibacterota bacterium]|nr:hypothetical protein [Candidatus Paceibacterota bacterium]